MDKFELQQRTRKFHVDVIKLCGAYPKNAAGFETAKQVIRSAGSVGSNYRAACRAKSKDDFIYKLDVVLEEADETLYWLQVSLEAELIDNLFIRQLINEADQLVAIFNAADITAKKNREKTNPKIPKSRNQKSSGKEQINKDDVPPTTQPHPPLLSCHSRDGGRDPIDPE
jgi:four helix bundle protein